MLVENKKDNAYLLNQLNQEPEFDINSLKTYGEGGMLDGMRAQTYKVY